jgi:hypothetical protein
MDWGCIWYGGIVFKIWYVLHGITVFMDWGCVWYDAIVFKIWYVLHGITVFMDWGCVWYGATYRFIRWCHVIRITPYHILMRWHRIIIIRRYAVIHMKWYHRMKLKFVLIRMLRCHCSTTYISKTWKGASVLKYEYVWYLSSWCTFLCVVVLTHVIK